jgi:hypothetical protein
LVQVLSNTLIHLLSVKILIYKENLYTTNCSVTPKSYTVESLFEIYYFTMMNFAATALLLSAVATDAATKVAVLEFGKVGSVHPSSAKSTSATVEGISTFWGALHGNRRNLQHAGMSLVPDLFHRPDNGVIIGVKVAGADLDSMPFLSGLVSGDHSQVVGVMEVTGSRTQELLSSLPSHEDIIPSSISEACKNHIARKDLSGLMISIDKTDSNEVDRQIEMALAEIASYGTESGSSIVVHIVIDEEDSVSRRKLSRRLEDQAAAEEGGDGAAAAEDNSGEGSSNYSGYYGYGYYNKFGNWVTPFKTMFQIQYFNVVLWTSIGLVAALFFTIGLMVYMPLEADTLLFGESAKFVGDD